MENIDPNKNNTTSDNGTARVQHVAKSSSDQLLRKFADSKDKSSSAKDLRLAKRVKRSTKEIGESNSCSSSSLADRKSLLTSSTSDKLIRRLGMSKAKIRAREIKNKSIITALAKTWRTTVQGASRVLMEKHYNRHKRLINDS